MFFLEKFYKRYASLWEKYEFLNFIFILLY